MSEYISIGKAADILGVSVVTLRRWERLGRLISSFRTPGDHRRYKTHEIYKITNKATRINVCYARVSSHDQKKDLVTQGDFLLAHCRQNNVSNVELINDLGSGLNFKKKGLKRLIDLIIHSKIDTIYLTHKDRLLRFGSELVFSIAQQFGTKITLLNNKTQSFDEQLATDVLEIITVCSARLYGSRSHKNKKLAAV
jgi:putative resolvase